MKSIVLVHARYEARLRSGYGIEILILDPEAKGFVLF